jgi:antitoxin PrlF
MGLEACKEFPYFDIMITSRLTTKAQTTIPQPVRAALGLRAGDDVLYEIDGGRVVLTKVRTSSPGLAIDDPFATFEEWNSEADRRAYGEL